MPRASSSRRSRRHTRNRSSSDESNSDEEFNPPVNSTRRLTQTQILSYTQRDAEANEFQNRETLINNLVKFFLNYSSTKVPIKRGDISKLVKITPKAFQEVYDEAVAKLQNVYGLTVDEIETKSGKTYIVYSEIETNPVAETHPEEQRIDITFLFICLAYIFMKSGTIQENHLFAFLSNLDIYDHETHERFGDIGKLIRDTYPKQLYLKRIKVDIEGTTESHFDISWGERAEAEFDKKTVLKKVAEMMNTSPATYINQYNEAYSQEQGENQTQSVTQATKAEAMETQ